MTSSLFLLFVLQLGYLKTSGQSTLNRPVGGSVDLNPGSIKITSITWKHNGDLASEWIGGQVEYYREFKGRCELNTSTGVLRIRDLTKSDNGTYTAEINYKVGPSLTVQVFARLPKPTVFTRCNDEKTSCDLTCEADITADMEPVEFSWKKDDKLVAGNKILRLTKEDKETSFMCRLTNPVDRKSSEEVENPLIDGTNNVGLTAGQTVGLVTVFILLVIPLLIFFFIVKKTKWFDNNETIETMREEGIIQWLRNLRNQPLVRSVGDSVDLNPGPIKEKITSITWKLNGDLVSEWNGDQVINYREFKGRCELNTETGVLTIRDLIPSDRGIYRVEINNKVVASLTVRVSGKREETSTVRYKGATPDKEAQPLTEGMDEDPEQGLDPNRTTNHEAYIPANQEGSNHVEKEVTEHDSSEKETD